MRPKICGECEHFIPPKDGSAMMPGLCQMMNLAVHGDYPSPNICPLPAAPKRTETFEAWAMESNGHLEIFLGRDFIIRCGRKPVRVRVTVEEIEP